MLHDGQFVTGYRAEDFVFYDPKMLREYANISVLFPADQVSTW